MYEEVNRILDNTKKDLEAFNRARDQEMQRTSAAIDTADTRSMENFAIWKEYLHKYFTVMLAFLTLVVGLTQVGKSIRSPELTWGIGFLGVSVLIGFFGIHWYLYVERRWIEISMLMAAMPAIIGAKMSPENTDNQFRYTNPIAEWRAKNKNEELALKEKIRTSTTKQDVKRYRLHLKGIKRETKLIKYVGATFGGWIEKIWLAFVLVSVLVSLVGVGFIIYALVLQESA